MPVWEATPVPCQQDGGPPMWPADSMYMELAHRNAVQAPAWQRAPTRQQLQILSHELAQAVDARECADRARLREQQQLLQACANGCTTTEVAHPYANAYN